VTENPLVGTIRAIIADALQSEVVDGYPPPDWWPAGACTCSTCFKNVASAMAERVAAHFQQVGFQQQGLHGMVLETIDDLDWDEPLTLLRTRQMAEERYQGVLRRAWEQNRPMTRRQWKKHDRDLRIIAECDLWLRPLRGGLSERPH
jgi:hypothetical protein